MKKVLGLFKGRHDLPQEVEDYIFTSEIDPADKAGIDSQVAKALADVQGLTLYVTGLTVATTAVLAYCIRNLVPVTLMHFDRVSGEYLPQVILSEDQCFTARNDYGINFL